MRLRERIALAAVFGVATLFGAGLSRAESTAPRLEPTRDDERLAELDAQLASPGMIERLEAVKALSALAWGGSGVHDYLARLEAARTDSSPAVARQAEAALVRRMGGESVPAQTRALHRSALALAEREEAVRGLSAESTAARLAAVKAVSALLAGGRSTEPSLLRELLERARADEDRAVAAQAAASLEQLAGRQPVDPEIRRRHRLRAEREEVDECEAELGSAAPIRRLEAVQRLAALAVTAGEPERVRALLDASLSDPDFNVSAQAAYVLDRLVARAVDDNQHRFLPSRRSP